jgi:hypothetical protein
MYALSMDLVKWAATSGLARRLYDAHIWAPTWEDVLVRGLGLRAQQAARGLGRSKGQGSARPAATGRRRMAAVTWVEWAAGRRC